MPTGLATNDMVKSYVDAVKNARKAWSTATADQRVGLLARPACDNLGKLGVPEVVSMVDPMGTMTNTDTVAAFNAGSWTTWFRYDAVAADVTDEQFWQLANSVYHEIRHAEQSFRVARKLAGENVDAAGIMTALGVRDTVAAKAVANRLPTDQNSAEWQEAKGWQLNMQRDANGISAGELVTQARDAAQQKYELARYRWRHFEWARDSDPRAEALIKTWYDTELKKANGKDTVHAFGIQYQREYAVGRELAKQHFLAYAKMPVEQDAWNVGGLVQTAMKLAPSTPEGQLEQFDKDQLARYSMGMVSALATGSDLERNLLKTLLGHQ
jgi:hypothetical protein